MTNVDDIARLIPKLLDVAPKLDANPEGRNHLLFLLDNLHDAIDLADKLPLTIEPELAADLRTHFAASQDKGAWPMRDKWGAAYWDETWHRYIVDHLWANDDPEFTAAYTVAINRWDAEHIHGDGTNYYDHEVTS